MYKTCRWCQKEILVETEDLGIGNNPSYPHFVTHYTEERGVRLICSGSEEPVEIEEN